MYVAMATSKRRKGGTVIYIVYIVASWLLNWPGALGFYLQPITLLHYDIFTLEFVVVVATIVLYQFVSMQDCICSLLLLFTHQL